MRSLPPRIRGLVGAIARDRRGATLVEMGVVAPVFCLFVIGIADLSQAVSQRFTMQQAIDRSLHMLVSNPPAGDPTDDDVDYSYVRTEAAGAAGVPVGNVTLTRWLQCDGEPEADYAAICEDGEDTARYVELEMTDTFTGTAWFGTINLRASGAVRIQ